MQATFSETTTAWLYDLSKRKENYEVSLSDSLDVKTSIVLVVVAFLAAISGMVLNAGAPSIWLKAIQALAILSVSVSGGCALRALWPMTYQLEDFPEKYAEWAKELERYYADQGMSDFSTDVLLQDDISEVSLRIRLNHQLNLNKSIWLFRSFKWLIPAIVTELSSVVLIGVRHLF